MAEAGAGISSGPTPWWQAPGRQSSKGGDVNTLQNLTKSAPPGYTYDPVQMGYTRTTQSAPWGLTQANKDVAFEDQLRSQSLDALKRASLAFGSFGAGGYGGFGGSITAGPRVPMPPQSSISTASVGAPDTSAAQSAAFGAAKAKAGAMGRASLESLRANLADRGILGGGAEATGLVDRLAAATNPLSDLNVAQQQENVESIRHSQDLAAKLSESNLSAGVAQRGQDIGAGVTQRGQDISAKEADLNRQQQLFEEQRQMSLDALRAALAGTGRRY